MKKIIVLLLITFYSVALSAQDSLKNDPRVAEGLRSNGKIYVVMVIVITILVGLFIYLIRLDRKIRKIENKQNRIV